MKRKCHGTENIWNKTNFSLIFNRFTNYFRLLTFFAVTPACGEAVGARLKFVLGGGQTDKVDGVI